MTENHRTESNALFSRREILGAGIAAGAVSQAQEKRPRIACVVTYWAAPGSHADWTNTKLLDCWLGGRAPISRVDVVSGFTSISFRFGAEGMQVERHSDL